MVDFFLSSIPGSMGWKALFLLNPARFDLNRLCHTLARSLGRWLRPLEGPRAAFFLAGVKNLVDRQWPIVVLGPTLKVGRVPIVLSTTPKSRLRFGRMMEPVTGQYSEQRVHFPFQPVALPRKARRLPRDQCSFLFFGERVPPPFVPELPHPTTD